MQRQALIILLLAVGSLCFAQKRNANWVFSEGAWCAFLPEGMVQQPLSYAASKRSTCISDTAGQFAMLVDDSGIRNAAFDLIVGGDAASLGWQGEAANYLILPEPGSTDVYMVFINEGPPSARAGYVVVDMAANGGSGSVLSMGTTWYMEHVTAKLTATTDAAEEGYWLVQHGEDNDAFHVFHVGAEGLSADPVVSHAGSTYLVDTEPYDNKDRWGPMKFSAGGDKLALVKHGISLDTAGIELFHFDRLTGTISDWVVLSCDYWAMGGDGFLHAVEHPSPHITDVEFDPDNMHFYAYAYNGVAGGNLIQYSTADTSASAVIGSAFSQIGVGGGYLTGFDQHGSDLNIGVDGILYQNDQIQSTLGNRLVQWRYLPLEIAIPGLGNALILPQLYATHYAGLPNLSKRYLDSSSVPTNIGSTTTSEQPCSVFPNPMTDRAVLRLVGPETPTSVRWRDAMGRVVRDAPVSKLGPSIAIDRQGLAAGIYVVELRSKDHSLGTVRMVCE